MIKKNPNNFIMLEVNYIIILASGEKNLFITSEQTQFSDLWESAQYQLSGHVITQKCSSASIIKIYNKACTNKRM